MIKWYFKISTKTFVIIFLLTKTFVYICYEIIRNGKLIMEIKPTDSELEILQVLWRLGKATVREVNEALAQKREIGYTTTLKLMQIMFEKKLVVRTEEGRYHVYKALVSENDTRQSLLNRFVDTTFRGSAMQLVMQALGSNTPSQEELDEIQKLLETYK